MPSLSPRVVLAIGSLSIALAVAACVGHARQTALVQRSRVSMGSELRVTAYAADEASGAAAIDEVFGEFERLEALMSVWRGGSEIQQLNAAAGDHAVPVSRDVVAVLRAARQISEWTGGKFDVTFGVLSDLWRFDHDRDNRVPDMNEVRRRLPLIDFRELEIDERAGTAFLKKRGMRAHLGGIGKGYAIDRAVEILRRRGLRDFLIQAGGDMYAAGRKDGRPWRLGIQDPRGAAGRSFAALDVSNATFSTSGDYERFFIKDGRRYHHILDPATGEPASACRSVTIVTDSATLADGLSTGVFLIGPREGMALLARLPNVDAVIVTSANEVLVTPRLQARLALAAPPTDAP